jgi:hypothetical protein
MNLGFKRAKRNHQFSIFGSLVLLSGAGLIIFSVYFAYRNLFPLFFWEKTSGRITGTMEEYDSSGESYVYERATYTDKNGNQFEVAATTSAGTSEANLPSSGNVIIFYNPENSAEALIFMWRNLLPVIILLPFGLVLVLFAWPAKK